MTRRNTRGEHTRARLVDAALRSFAAKGFHGTGTRDIAEAAGMSQAAVYVHYTTKEELLYQLTLDGHRAVEAAVVQAVRGVKGPVEQLRTFVRAFTVWHAHEHTLARVIQYEMGALSEEHVGEIATLRRGIEHRLRRIVAAGVRQGEFTVPDPKVATRAVLSLGIDVARWYRDDGAWTPEQLGEHYAVLALQLVRSG